MLRLVIDDPQPSAAGGVRVQAGLAPPVAASFADPAQMPIQHPAVRRHAREPICIYLVEGHAHGAAATFRTVRVLIEWRQLFLTYVLSFLGYQRGSTSSVGLM